MTGWITPRRFHEAEGVDDWRMLARGVCAHFITSSLARGIALVGEIGKVFGNSPSAPEIDLRDDGVTVLLPADPTHGLRQSDVERAKAISAVAHDLDLAADPAAAQDIQLTIDATDISAVRAFWRAVLGYRERNDDVDLLDPRSRGPALWFQQMDRPRTQRNRIHVDIFVPHDQAEVRVAAALAAGGRLVSDDLAPAWWTLADPEGNEADIATWMGRD